jgi:phosphoribosyl-ATP pyrophosphohydrolase/phosphoribosyl-AMP cyclohydrolase
MKPAIIQDFHSGKVLMLGYMTEEALQITRQTGKVTFFSRSKQRLWTKGETSGNFLLAKQILHDCDDDTILVKAIPSGPVCHTGADTCFGEKNKFSLAVLESVIADRKDNPSGSYTSTLFQKGINAVSQKFGEEAVELLIESKDENREKFLGEAADLLFHFLVLLRFRGYGIENVLEVLSARHTTSNPEAKG